MMSRDEIDARMSITIQAAATCTSTAGRRGTPPDVDHVERPLRACVRRREAEHVGGEGQVGAGPAHHPRHLRDRVMEGDEDVVELGQQLDQVFRKLLDPQLTDQARRHLASASPVGDRGEGEELEAPALGVGHV